MTRITKEALLAGARPEPFEVPALGEEVLLVPLSAPEAAEVQAALMAPYRTVSRRSAGDPAEGPERVGKARRRGHAEQETVVEQSEVVTAFYRTNVLATAYGLADPAMTLEEVEAWRNAPAIEQIGKEVMARSGLGTDQREQLRRFREHAERSGDPDAPSLGEPAGSDTGPADAPSA